MNTTPTSGAADLRATFSEMLVDLPNTEPYTLFQAGFDAALAAGQATAAQAVVPAGWKLVPEQPTLPMLINGSDTDTSTSAEDCRRVYRAMLAAAPAQPAAQQGAAYAALPESFLEIPDVQDESGINAYYSREVVLECIDAALASHGQAPADAKALAEADRRAGEAERLLATCKEYVMRFEQVRSRMKYQWGAEQRVSFDEVWDEALALKKAAQADSVLEDAAREAIEKVLALFPFNALIQKFSVNNGPCLTADNDDEFYSVKRVLAFLTEIKTTLDAARKQGEKHDR